MSNRIAILPELVANKIAAGEVVERPASVVKELLENSLDAEATEVTIDIMVGGKRLIRVQDNGLGMSKNDSLLAFERFGTSKVKTSEDLDSIMTLGFRGEALASISSVSQVVLMTRERGTDAGTEVIMNGGILKKVGEVGCREGTMVEVKNLFFNTPARRAFMASTDTEFFWVNQTVTQYALCRPDVGFILTHNDRKVIDAAAASEATPDSLPSKGRIASVLGHELLDKIIPISAEADDLSLSGYIGLPTKATATGKRLQSMFINRRSVSSKPLYAAIYEAYGPYLMRGRYPALILFLKVDPRTVNVNVHPTKREVKFMQQSRITDFVKKAVAEALRKTLRGPVVEVTRNLRTPSATPPEPMTIDLPEAKADPPESETTETTETPLDQAIDAAQPDRVAPPQDSMEARPAAEAPRPEAICEEPEPSENLAQRTDEPHSRRHTTDVPRTQPAPAKTPTSAPAESRPDSLFSERLVPVGQIESSYVIAQGAGAVVIIDQHAAHERIYYDKFKRQVRLGRIPSQRLLMPALIETSPAMQELLLINSEMLESMGLEIDDFGGGSIAVKSKPALLSDEEVEQIVAEIGELLLQSKSVRDASFNPIDEICALYACKAAIKADRPLSMAEMQDLLDQLAETEFPMTCPHGRPTTVELDMNDLRKSFLRSGKK
ncbi:MAG: DNA mismatch repair endonuclease MutL [Candidatus Coatesbacteria bacterium]|nr:DNA mismatch repair endonuclease MutL [Candidatus Coatesbacteria bacterium]